MSSLRRPRLPRHYRYKFLRRLGQGGSGHVYLAQDLLDDGREVALKVARHELAPDQLVREFRVLRELRHPGIARAHDFGRLPGGSAYFTMEYVAGTDLERRGASLRPLAKTHGLAAILDAFLQVTEALAYLHHHGLVHLDVKPSNIVLADGRAKLIDFGLFQRPGVGGFERPRGTAYFSAPEVFDGRGVDQLTDLYALGVSLHRVLTGRFPITGDTIEELAENHRSQRPQLHEALPPGLSRLIAKLLEKLPRKRPQSADEVLWALRELAPEAPGELDRRVYREAPCLGRESAMTAFFGWLDGVRGGEGPCVLAVEGAAGIGKSRLVDAYRTEALTLGVQVIPVHSAMANGESGLRTLVEKARLVRPLGVKERAQWRFLLSLLGLRQDSRARREAAALSLEAVQGRVFQETLELLCARTSPPLVILIEDLHRSDAQLRGFVSWLSSSWPPHLSRAALGVLLTARRSEPEGRDAPSAGENVVTVSLGPLDRHSLRAILAEQVPPPGAAKSRELLLACRGNPGDLARALRGHAQPNGSGQASSATLATVTVEQLHGLRPGTRNLVVALAMLERPASVKVLLAATGLSLLELKGAHAEIATRGWASGVRDAWVLEDDVAALVRSLPRDEVAPTQARLGHALRLEPCRVREAARHLLHAGSIPEGLSTLDIALLTLRSSGRLDEAASLLQEALVSIGPEALGPTRLEELGELEERCGRFDRAEQHYAGALATADRSASDRLRLLRRRGGILQRQGDTRAALELLETAASLVDAASDIEEELHLRRELAAVQLFAGDGQQARSIALRGIELLESGRARGVPRDLRARHRLDFHAVLGHIHLREFAYELAAEEFQRGLAQARIAASLAGEALLLNYLGIAYHQANRLGEALRVYRRAMELSGHLGDSTTLLTSHCNVAAIRARLGDGRTAERMLLEAEGLPQARKSRRARLFLLYTRGLVTRLGLEDARDPWLEAIRLAGEIPDSLIAASARLFLLENEIQQGRWREARSIVRALTGGVGDQRLARSVQARHAYLEALLGHRQRALALLGARPAPEARLDHAGLWDLVYLALTLIELGNSIDAEPLLEKARQSFHRSRQLPGEFFCCQHLADAALRRREGSRVASRLAQARDVRDRLEVGSSSRGAVILLPWLEARAALLVGGTSSHGLGEALKNARREVERSPRCEARWLIDLVAAESGQPGAERRLRQSRAAFVKALLPADRHAYRARDFLERLGLRPHGEEEDMKKTARSSAALAAPPATVRRYEALLALQGVKDHRQALDLLLDATGARGAALFLQGEPGAVTIRGRLRGTKREQEQRRTDCLRVGSGIVENGICAELRGPEGARPGVIYLETARDSIPGDLQSFLDVAGVILGASLPPVQIALAASPTAKPMASGLSTRTRTLSPILLASEAPCMRKVVSLVQKCRDSILPILLTGESGSGKDHLARWIHSLSPRREAPFVAQDCSAIPSALLEAEILGYEAGAFSGADRARAGCLMQAQSGTFYLDNVDSLLPEVQAKLIRVLATRTVRPLGSATLHHLDVRLISSSQRDLRDLVERGEFRRDLYFRLAGIPITVPSLRERAEDVPLLVAHFCSQLGGKQPAFTPEARAVLQQHSWPGNIRELESVVRRLALTSDASIDDRQVRAVLGLAAANSSFPHWAFAGRTYEQVVEEVKREYLLHLFKTQRGDMQQIARELGLTKRNAYLRYAQLGLRPQELRAGGAI